MIYDMYSRKEQPRRFTNLYLIVADDDTLNLISIPILQEGVIANSLKLYHYHSINGHDIWDNALVSRQQRLGENFTNRSNKLLRNNKNAVEAYPEWLKKYISKNVVRRDVKRLSVYATTIDNKFGFNFNEQKIIDVE